MSATDWKKNCPWCGVDLSELTGRCYCGREPPKLEIQDYGRKRSVDTKTPIK